MENKQISYIVFKDYDKDLNKQEGIVFFNDGSYLKVDRNILINYLIKYSEQENIKSLTELLYSTKRVKHITNDVDDKVIIDKYIKKSLDDLGHKIEKVTEDQIKEKKNNLKNESNKKKNITENVVKDNNDTEELKDDLELDNCEEQKTLFDIIASKSKKIKIRLAVIGLSAVTAIVAGGFHLLKHSKTGIMKNDIETTETAKDKLQDKFNEMSFNELLKATKDETQMGEMAKIGDYLDKYNNNFANSHLEDGTNIKAALSWDEVVALTLGYNDFHDTKLSSVFNGSTLNSESIISSFKSANDQLTKAFVIEDIQESISLDNLISEPEQKAFYNKYHELFKRIKISNGAEQINYINSFNSELVKDFLIDDSNKNFKDIINQASYKLSILPMINASEIVFSNLDIDKSLSSTVYQYFNSANVDEVIRNKFTSYESKMLTAEFNKINPSYDLFKKQKIDELESKSQYGINDNLRDLSKLNEYLNINKPVENEIVIQQTTMEEQKNNSTNNTYYNNEIKTNNNTSDNTTSQEETTQTQKNDLEIPSIENITVEETVYNGETEKLEENIIIEDEEDFSGEEPAGDENYEEETINDEDIEKDTTEDEDIEKDTTEDEDKEKGTTEDELDNILDIDEAYKNDNGTFTDDLKSITINGIVYSTDEYTLEEIADLAVEEMANQDSSSQNSSVYTK